MKRRERTQKADCLSDLKKEIVKLEQQNVVINEEKVKKQYRKMPNWMAPANDSVQGFGIKRLDKIHGRIDPRRNKRNTCLDDV